MYFVKQKVKIILIMKQKKIIQRCNILSIVITVCKRFPNHLTLTKSTIFGSGLWFALLASEVFVPLYKVVDADSDFGFCFFNHE